jgi:hypothetical protein
LTCYNGLSTYLLHIIILVYNHMHYKPNYFCLLNHNINKKYNLFKMNIHFLQKDKIKIKEETKNICTCINYPDIFFNVTTDLQNNYVLFNSLHLIK